MMNTLETIDTLETMPPLSEAIATLVLEQTDQMGISLEDEQFSIFLGHGIRIGRDASKCNHVIHSNLVSKQHFRIYSIIYEEEQDLKNPPLIYCEDLESVNGTWVNNNLIGMIGSPRKGYLLSDGDLIQIKPYWAFRFYQNFSGMETVVDVVQEAEKQHFVDRYAIQNRVLGCGVHGRVYLTYDNMMKVQLACKVVDLRPFRREPLKDEVFPEFVKPACPEDYGRKSHLAQELSRMLREVDILSKLNHPNVVSLKKAFQSENTLFLFQELATGGDLFSFLQNQGGKLNDLHSCIISRQVALAIEYLHSQGIAHRDLKPENILVTHTDIGHRVMLTDFGSSTLVANAPSRLMSIVGTEGYVAPEVKRKPKSGGYTKAIDMWSLGVVTTCLLTGGLLIPQDEQRQHEQELRKNEITVTLRRNIDRMLEAKGPWEDVGVRARDFLKKLLVINPEERMNATQAVHHHWFARSKEFAKELEQLYERANKHWSPRRETNIFEQLPEISTTTKAKRNDRGTANKPVKRQKRLPDSTASPYYSLDHHLRPKMRSKRKELLNKLEETPSHMFLPDFPLSAHKARPSLSTISTLQKSKLKKVPGNNLFGLTSQIDSPGVESEPKTRIQSKPAVDKFVSRTSKVLADSGESEVPKSFQATEELQDCQDTLQNQDDDTQESQELHKHLERQQSMVFFTESRRARDL